MHLPLDVAALKILNHVVSGIDNINRDIRLFQKGETNGQMQPMLPNGSSVQSSPSAIKGGAIGWSETF